MRSSYIFNGKPDPAASESTYGVWIADIERPATQYRGRYQLQLANAQKLIADTCPGLQGINVTAPISRLTIKRQQHSARSGRITVGVVCPGAPCSATAGAFFRLPGRKNVVKIYSDTSMLSARQNAEVRIELVRSMRKRLKSALAYGPIRVRLRIAVAGTNGASTVRIRTIKLVR